MQQRRATASKQTGLDKPILQRSATRGNRCRRIVAPGDAGLNPSVALLDAIVGLKLLHSDLGLSDKLSGKEEGRGGWGDTLERLHVSACPIQNPPPWRG